ncbi:MAG: glutamine-synthetase adenylyltransferase, partial [Pseudomonadota bacterium]
MAAEAQSAVAALLGQKAEDAAEDAAADPRVALGAGAAGGAPFLARLLRREGAWLAPRWARSPEAAFWELAADLAAAGASAPDHAAFGAAMRVARRRLALTAALADLGSVWDLDATTAALTLFAEAAVSAVLTRLLREEAASGAMPSLDPERSGVFALAMGKMGAFELNYSSDVDLILLYDESRLAAADRARAPERFAKLARDFIRLLSRVDAEGYVARVDLRLRPDPGATPPVVSTASALRYYQTQGRAWERAAHVKARVCAGDRGAGAAYLEALRPFVWRRRVDFAAIEDAAEMLAKIRAHEGGGAVAFAGQDVKLGAGGIREIEFLAQSHQLISGGREPALRAPGTRAVLALLAEAGRIAPETAMALDEAYLHLRRLEHRIQMVEDQQTHRVPKDAEGRARLAGLFGDEPNAAGAARLEARTLAAMRAVREAASPNFDAAPAPKPSEAEAALMEAAAGFAEPARAVAIAQGWFRKDYRALRHERARARLSRLAPEILSRLGAAADPQRALGQFDRFLAGLPAGVRVLAMLEADDAVLDLVAEICAAAPRLAQRLAQKSQLLDAAMDRDFYAAPPGLEARLDELRPRLTREGGEDYERVLDAARRWAAERRFQIGACLLKGEIAPEAAGRAYSDVAEAALRGLWPYVLGAQEARAGAAPRRGAAGRARGRRG